MDAVESTSPPSLRHKLRTTVCGCFGSPAAATKGHKAAAGPGGGGAWRPPGSSGTTRSATRSTSTTAAAAATTVRKQRTPTSGTETSTRACRPRRCRPPEPSRSPEVLCCFCCFSLSLIFSSPGETESNSVKAVYTAVQIVAMY
ncbi:hypothetical protein ACQJBY_039659 [Aegilops geniculata]